ncbi:hypothetical protein Hanom_Chr17g01586081 [Helianthus anomalus]
MMIRSPKTRFFLLFLCRLTYFGIHLSSVPSCGLVCLFGFYRCEDDAEYYPRDATAVLWNPSIRKSVAIPVPNVGGYDEVTFGFGVCGN